MVEQWLWVGVKDGSAQRLRVRVRRGRPARRRVRRGVGRRAGRRRAVPRAVEDVHKASEVGPQRGVHGRKLEGAVGGQGLPRNMRWRERESEGRESVRLDRSHNPELALPLLELLLEQRHCSLLRRCLTAASLLYRGRVHLLHHPVRRVSIGSALSHCNSSTLVGGIMRWFRQVIRHFGREFCLEDDDVFYLFLQKQKIGAEREMVLFIGT